MSVVYCDLCERQVDIDQEDDHFSDEMVCLEDQRYWGALQEVIHARREERKRAATAAKDMEKEEHDAQDQ